MTKNLVMAVVLTGIVALGVLSVLAQHRILVHREQSWVTINHQLDDLNRQLDDANRQVDVLTLQVCGLAVQLGDPLAVANLPCSKPATAKR